MEYHPHRALLSISSAVYGVLMVLTGAASWAELGQLSIPAGVALGVGVLSLLLAPRIRNKHSIIWTDVALASALAMAGIIAGIPGVIQGIAALGTGTLSDPNIAASEIAIGIWSTIELVVTLAVFVQQRRGEHPHAPRNEHEEPMHSAGYSVMGQ